MAHRQKQHLGRSQGDEREMPGRDVKGSVDGGEDAISEVEQAREISGLIDDNERQTRPADPGREG